MNRGCQSYLMRQRRWFISMFSSRTSFAVLLPWFSLPAMKLIRSIGRKKGHYRGLRGQRKAKEQERLQVWMCLRPEPSASIWSHGAKRWTPRDVQKATTINRRRSATALIPKRIWRWMTKDGRSRGFRNNKGRVFRLNWIKVGSLESTIFKSAL